VDSIVITIPLAPDAALLPNRRHRRGGHHPGIAAARELRFAAKCAALPHATGTALAGPVGLHVHVAYPRSRRLPDLDASLSASKGAVDGLVDGGILVDDRQVAAISVTHERLGKGADGYTRITIVELEAEA
jgi:Holliday junction resolvase RusA-like endonuclease